LINPIRHRLFHRGSLTNRREAFGLQLHWVDTEAGEVWIVGVPKSSEVVSLKPKSGPEEFYVRRAALNLLAARSPAVINSGWWGY
jgi:hypothetical protein